MTATDQAPIACALVGVQTEATETTRAAAIATFLALDGVEKVRGCRTDTETSPSEDNPDEDEITITWTCEVLHLGCWYPASLPDHWPEGAEVIWS